jgi:hypothetical protein
MRRILVVLLLQITEATATTWIEGFKQLQGSLRAKNAVSKQNCIMTGSHCVS